MEIRTTFWALVGVIFGATIVIVVATIIESTGNVCVRECRPTNDTPSAYVTTTYVVDVSVPSELKCGTSWRTVNGISVAYSYKCNQGDRCFDGIKHLCCKTSDQRVRLLYNVCCVIPQEYTTLCEEAPT